MELDPFGWQSIINSYLRAIGWSVVAALGFSIGIGLALKVFDWMSTDIEEWEEIKNGNMGVSLIFITLIASVAFLIHKVL
ncbi:MAG TPA: DUF350 domain-containing protein [Candidatus Marinimicrobia bacterium]|jgi:uncharacterized membrane protein YjfL (UPF0719 family)|nr:DUF350 domain-containing protein [Candidatus Neomarinimicrobiota bacterium]HIB02972.1 DUF350 domain-containing protein [Candidatus Neomarinimicrobiota bacterium]HIB70510.1 DUF350 domain-containing protein [Candidatus Neomarinimicrobiota bacterium]HIB95804.1 DUF350 domain-containing protein [Candidatus Neomarinimicrobiota bacterium]HIN62678.1 DUF350 domain-containing protein [Candidatus Neomarinimicrobiota bacterium]